MTLFVETPPQSCTHTYALHAPHPHYTHAHLHTRTSSNTLKLTHTHTHARMCTHKHSYKYTHTHTHTHTRMCTYKHSHKHLHTYTCTHTHTHTHTHTLLWSDTHINPSRCTDGAAACQPHSCSHLIHTLTNRSASLNRTVCQWSKKALSSPFSQRS